MCVFMCVLMCALMTGGKTGTSLRTQDARAHVCAPVCAHVCVWGNACSYSRVRCLFAVGQCTGTHMCKLQWTFHKHASIPKLGSRNRPQACATIPHLHTQACATTPHLHTYKACVCRKNQDSQEEHMGTSCYTLSHTHTLKHKGRYYRTTGDTGCEFFSSREQQTRATSGAYLSSACGVFEVLRLVVRGGASGTCRTGHACDESSVTCGILPLTSI